MHGHFSFPDEEKRMVEEVFNNAIDCLSDEDKKLPQVSKGGFVLHALPSPSGITYRSAGSGPPIFLGENVSVSPCFALQNIDSQYINGDSIAPFLLHLLCRDSLNSELCGIQA